MATRMNDACAARSTKCIAVAVPPTGPRHDAAVVSGNVSVAALVWPTPRTTGGRRAARFLPRKRRVNKLPGLVTPSARFSTTSRISGLSLIDRRRHRIARWHLTYAIGANAKKLRTTAPSSGNADWVAGARLRFRFIAAAEARGAGRHLSPVLAQPLTAVAIAPRPEVPDTVPPKTALTARGGHVSSNNGSGESRRLFNEPGASARKLRRAW